MTFSIALVSLLAIIHQSTSAPFNDPVSNVETSSDTSHNGWSCAYHGNDPNVNPSLDLPQLVKTLCSQVHYANVGCMAFTPGGQHTLSGTVERPVEATPPASAPCPPPLQWNTTLSICTLEIPYVPIIVDVSPPGQPLMQGEPDPAIIKNVNQTMSGYEDGKVYAFSIGDPVVVDDDGGEPDAPSVVVEQAHGETPPSDAPLPPLSPPSSPSNGSSAVIPSMIPAAPMGSMIPTTPMASMMPATTSQPKKPSNNKKPAKAQRPSKVNSAPSTKSHPKQCGSSHLTGAFSFDSGKHSSRSIHSEESGSCGLTKPVHKAKKPSSHQPKSTGIKPASPKPANHHNDSGPESSKVTAQSFDEPEGDENDNQPSSHPKMSTDYKPASPKPSNHHDDSGPDSSRVTAQSFDEPEGDEDSNPPSGKTQGNNHKPTTSYSPVSTTSSQSHPPQVRKPESSPQANQDSPVRHQAEKECQSPKHWDNTLSLCVNVSGNPDISIVGSILASTPTTNQTAQIQNATIQNDADKNHPIANSIEGNQRALSTSTDCEAPLQWNSVLSMCMKLSVLPNTPIGSTADVSSSMNAPADLLHSHPSSSDGQAGQPIDPEQACQSPSRWNAVLRLCMGISALPNAESFNPSNTLAPVSGLPAQITQSVAQMIGTKSPDSQNCDANETWSSIANRCVANSLLSSPHYGGDCGAAQYDSLIGMCLNTSILAGSPSGNHDSNPIPIASILGDSLSNNHKSNPTSQIGDIAQNSPVVAQILKSQNTNGPSCATGQKWSGLAASCVPNDRLTTPKGDGSCEAGKYDSLIGMCLSTSILGSQNPAVPTTPSVTDYSSGTDQGSSSPIEPITSGSVPGCSENQRYSILARACVDLNMLSKPSGGQDCGTGAQFDNVLGHCVNLSAAAGLFGSKTTELTQMKSTSQVLSLPDYI
ncbi:hypothetical protein DFH28DRAFT_1159636 [Melampsora americana]|nr:hypothetical protein DFH28DRAFT_1159636 [Melampsora americana]